MLFQNAQLHSYKGKVDEIIKLEAVVRLVTVIQFSHPESFDMPSTRHIALTFIH